MALDFVYQPLLENEIRLLKIEDVEDITNTTNTSKRRPIACSIEHVCLPPAAKHRSDQQFKGKGRTWPELPTQHHFAPLFKPSRGPHVDEADSRQSGETLVGEDADLPWRHEWGDFIALSYVWGHPKPSDGEDCHFITVNGCPFKVTPNLYYALDQLRKSYRVRQGFKLWVDAVCIDQTNAEERGQQVARMRDIYQSAWQVVIWLGPSDRTSELAFLALHWLSQESKEAKPMEDFYQESFSIDLRPLFIMWPKYHSPMEAEVYKALFHFFTRPYWRRMWIVQEVAMGNPNTPILCGDECISWNDIYQAVQVIASDESRFGREILDSTQPQLLLNWSSEIARDRQLRGRTWAPERMWKVQHTMMRIQKDQHTGTGPSGWNELVRAVNLARDALVTDDKDRVYGILGIKAIADRVNIKPDYNLSMSTIYSNFATELMLTGDLNILRLASGHGGYVVGNWEIEHLPPMLRNRFMGSVILPLMDTFARSPERIAVGVPCEHYLPSWSVCWACAPSPTAQLGGTYHADLGLDRSIPTFSRSQATLTTKGILLDKITSLSSSNHAEADPRYPCNSIPASKSRYGDFEATREVFWRTIVGDTIPQGGEKAPESYAWLLEPKLWQRGIAGVWTNGFGLHNFMLRNSALNICGFTIQELIFGRKKFQSWVKQTFPGNVYNPTEKQQEMFSWAVNAMAWRRVFGTRDGRMGMGSGAAQVGDSVVLLIICWVMPSSDEMMRQMNGIFDYFFTFVTTNET
ncbi:unnamed protein product [Fusarium equiseti]|uniref:Heterokaryon incompatibility domain-containing protein n=1 Tax=Fusarium equiseti TaxID=61235 RepID=A0A8J2IP95_FUSEQ|nr:unnamed protein product [Fusarium equiseti]